MQSAWNSWPQGRLMTLLTPSTYSSRQTTHSTCLPMYFLHSAEKPPAPFSCSFRALEDPDGVGTAALGARKFSLSSTPVVVLERGRGRDALCCCCRSGVVGVALAGDGSRGDELVEEATV